MIYLGDQWPKDYRGKLLTLNLHGRRANVERLEPTLGPKGDPEFPHGTRFVGKREPDMLFATDPFFRGIDLTYGPDGSVFVLDWSDTGECHENTGVHRTSGRIFRVTFGDPKPKPAPDVTKMTVRELLDAHHHPNAWYARQARIELLARQDAGKPVPTYFEAFDSIIRAEGRQDAHYRLFQTIFALRVVPEVMLPLVRNILSPRIKPLTVRYEADLWPLDTVTGVPRADGVEVPAKVLDHLIHEAKDDYDGLTRLHVASALQRLPVKHRPKVAAALLSRADDATDPNIPFLVWYGLIPVARQDPVALILLASDGKFPKVREWAARHFAERHGKEPHLLDGLLARTKGQDEAARRDVVAGMTAGFAGVRKAAPPAVWQEFPKTFTGPDADRFAAQVRNLDVVFGDGRALDEVRRLALDDKADLGQRKAALRSLIEAKPDDLRAVCEKLLRVRFLNAVALDGLARFDDPAVGKLIAKTYRTFHPSERPAAVEALASRPAFAAELLELVAAGTVARAELSAAQARQIRSFEKPELTKRLAEVWGEFRDSPKEKADLIERLKADLTPARLAAADKSRGRAVFANSCASCHRLFGAGGEIGPDLTGAGRKDLDYLLSNVVDPSAVVTKDFQMTVFALADGRTVSGVVVGETDQAVTVQAEKARVVIPKGDVDKRTPSPLSLMPDGLLQPLTPEQVRDLVAYLMSEAQVELPKEGK
jgi:putative heme-binding domain-containing protein